MAKRILIVQGHPDGKQPHLCHALADAYAAGAAESGIEVRRIDVATLDFPLLRTQEEFERATPPAGLTQALADIAWCDHMVVVFPLWLGGAPALLQGFFEQTMRPGYAFRYLEGGRSQSLMKGRSARLLVTMGMPAFIYRFWFMAHGVRRISRGILGFVGFSPVRETLFGMVADANDAKRARWLAAMRELGRRGG
ncbi:MAG: NAD(P)H-dependent oxidoreductase [Beijerinckiaceae bacterium]|nr:NAD(P)H-dependent oxidoreductase [Beijerinckiaceae bacterium]